MSGHQDDARSASLESPRQRLRRIVAGRYVAAALAVAALILALGTQLAYTTDAGLPWTWVGFVSAALLFAAAVHAASHAPLAAEMRGPGVRDGLLTLTTRQEIAILVVVLLVAVFFRCFRFGDFPPGLWYDEAINGTDALSIIDRDHLTVWRESNFGHSTLFFYLLIASYKMFGFTVFAMRLVPVLAGLGAVVAFYFLARWLTGPVPALIATALLAAGRWAVTFSRISWEASLMPVLEIMSVLFLVKALETRNRFYFFMAGGSLAAGIYTYLAFRFVPIVLAFILVYVVVTEWRLIRGNISGLLVYAASFVIVIAPLGQYAVRHQDQFLERTREINVFREVDEKDSWEPLRHNVRASIGMMNVTGDGNGRHNLPGEPMLDVITGVLFVLGMAASVWGLRSWRRGHVAGWYLLVLIPGALTISVENPSAIRVIGAIPPIYLAVALALATIQRSLAPVRHGAYAFGALALVLVATSIGANYYTLFERQAHDFAVYEAFTPEYTQIGEIVADRADAERVYVSRDYEGHPAVRVLSRGKEYRPYTVADDLVFAAGDQDVLIIADSLQVAAIPTLQRLYPGLTRDDYIDPFGRTFFTRLTIPAEDTRSLHELPMSVTRGGVVVPSAPPRAPIDREWTEEDLADGPLTVTWEGFIWTSQFPGVTEFEVPRADEDAARTTESVVLDIDGRTYDISARRRVTMPPGQHAVRLTAMVTAPGRLRIIVGAQEQNPTPARDVLYGRSVGPGGFRVLYRSGTDFSVEPQLLTGAVPFAAPADVFRVYRALEYQAVYVASEEGVYGFALEGANSAQLFVNDQLIADNGGSHSSRRVEGEVSLAAGPQVLTIQYTVFDRPNWAVSVRRPGGDWEMLDGDEVAPPTGAYAPPALVRLRPDDDWPGQLALDGVGKAVAVAALPDGRLFVAAKDAVAIVSADGTVERTFDVGLTDINDVAASASGELYVIDGETRTLVVLDTEGNERGRLTGAFDSARGVGTYPGGALVASPAGGLLYRVPRDGADVETLEMSTDIAKAKQPSDVDIGPDGRIYAADFDGKRIVVSTDDGATVATTFAGITGTGGQLPHLAVTDKLIFVTDPVNQRIVVFDRAGKQRGAYVFPTTLEGLRPLGIAASGNYVYIADVESGLVYRFTVDVPPETAAELP